MENLFEEGETEKSEFQVRVVKIEKIDKHPNADTLSIADVEGYPVVIKTGAFKVGDLAVYVPVDALVPVARPEFSFLASKDHPERIQHRVKAARLRGIFSMGLLVPHDGITGMIISVGANCQAALGIEKWIPPSERINLMKGNNAEAQARARKYRGPKLPIYGVDPLRRYDRNLPEGTEVVITEKIHGCNSRFVFSDGRLWVGSHRVMRGCSKSVIGLFFERLKLKVMSLFRMKHRAHTLSEFGDIWWEAAEAYNLKERLSKFPDMVLYGEVYGEGVQFLSYDSPKGRKMRIFDMYDLKKKCFVDHAQFLGMALEMGFKRADFVPTLYVGPWNSEIRNKWLAWANTAMSTIWNENDEPTGIAEGIVVKPVLEMMDPRIGRVILKYVGEGYLLSDDKKGNVGGKRAKYKKDKAEGFPLGDRVERPAPGIAPNALEHYKLSDFRPPIIDGVQQQSAAFPPIVPPVTMEDVKK